MQQAYARTWMLRDWRIWSELDHPHVLAASDYGETNDALFVATQWLGGPSLRAVLDQRRTLDPGQIRELAGQLAGALDAAAALRLVHLDVKPENVLFSSADGLEHAYVRDFGAGRLAAWKVGADRSRRFRGTLEYAAPEVIGGGAVDRRTAVYSLGCLLYEALTGATPYAGRSRESSCARIKRRTRRRLEPGRETWTACSRRHSRRTAASVMGAAPSSRTSSAQRSNSRGRRVRLSPPGAGVSSVFAMRSFRRASQSSRPAGAAAAAWLPIGAPAAADPASGEALPTRDFVAALQAAGPTVKAAHKSLRSTPAAKPVSTQKPRARKHVPAALASTNATAKPTRQDVARTPTVSACRSEAGQPIVCDRCTRRTPCTVVHRAQPERRLASGNDDGATAPTAAPPPPPPPPPADALPPPPPPPPP